MNGKRAKQIRHAAVMLEVQNNNGAAAPWRQYTKATKTLIWERTYPGGFILPTRYRMIYTPRLESFCVRSVYQRLKKFYRAAIKAGVNQR